MCYEKVGFNDVLMRTVAAPFSKEYRNNSSEGVKEELDGGRWLPCVGKIRRFNFLCVRREGERRPSEVSSQEGGGEEIITD